MKRRPPSDDELTPWREIAAETTPLRSNKAKKKTPPAPRNSAESDEKPAKEPTPARPAEWMPLDLAQTSSLDRRTLKKISSRRIPIDATLDLHGFTLDEAWEKLHAFLDEAQAQSLRTLLVVTGRGRSGEGKLRQSLPKWLETDRLRAKIAGWEVARRTHGGDGAFYIRLKRPR